MKRRMLSRVLDAVFAVALAAVAIAEIWVPLSSATGTGSRELSTVVAVILCLTLAARRRSPLATALVVVLTWPIVFSIQPILVLFWGQLVPIVIATYSVSRYGSRRAAIIGGLAAATTLLFFDLRVTQLQEPGEIVFHWLVLSLAWIIGAVVRRAERRASESRKHAVEVETLSRTVTLQAIADERARIARELHDVVAHAVSVMVVQAGAAEQVIDDDPAYARSALVNIRATGADALTEMRRVVAMLRDDSHEPLRPQPGLDALPGLIEDARLSGLDATLALEGTPRPLPPGLDLAAYRILQEALTNVRRHASATRVELVVDYSGTTVRLEVRDDGNGGPRSTEGHGLIGMRERATLYGGRLETVASENRGFVVRAVLPWAP